MKKNLSATVIFLAFITIFSGCKKEKASTPAPLTAAQAKNLVADPAATNNRFTFFSLERNVVVPYADSATTKWDIAFRSTTILTNSGTSGPGAGGAFVQRSVSFDSYGSIPGDSTFKTDTAPNFAIRTGSGNGWYNYNPSTNIITPIPGNIIVVRTASGKYAKVEVLSYYKDAPASPAATDVPRYYTFRFIYQPNGSNIF